MWGKVAQVATRSVPILNGIVIAATIVVEVASVIRKTRNKY